MLLAFSVMSWFAALAAEAPTDAGLVGQITLQERDALDLVIRTPYSGGDAQTSTRRFVDVAEQALRAKSALFAREVKDSKEVLDAKGDLVALLKATRRDFDVDRLASEGKSLEAHNAERRAAGERLARFLVLITLLPQDDKTRISAILVDADEGLDLLLREHGRGGGEELAARFSETAVIARPTPALVTSEDEAVAYVGRLFSQEFQPMFDRLGAWETLGAIDVETNVDGAEIRVDGTLVGTSRRGVTRLLDARAGPRAVSLSAVGYEPKEVSAQVAATETVKVVVELDAAGVTAPTFAFWGGLGVATVGVAIVTAAAIGQNTQDPTFLCVFPEGQDCTGWSWLRSGGGTGAEAVRGSPSGLAYAPFGVGLAVGGGLLALGSKLFEDDRMPWISLAAGIAAGSLTYVLLSSIEDPQQVTVP